ncbi:hypothetical protein Leryth_024287 [Lithospermum erythrorhizon]|nr:hypothetical protein Leryth_024287 [Lithospermum erythrorhizon]
MMSFHCNILTYLFAEYGSEGLVSRAVDVYSFGILLMETFTGKKPSDEMFTDNLNLKDWVHKYFLNDQLVQVIDSKLLNLYGPNINQAMQCVSKIMELALNCCVELPNNRMNMNMFMYYCRRSSFSFQNRLAELKEPYLQKHRILRKAVCI